MDLHDGVMQDIYGISLPGNGAAELDQRQNQHGWR
jgi:hypothetical protein